MRVSKTLTACAFAAGLAFAAGCGKSSEEPKEKGNVTPTKASDADHDHEGHEHEGHDHKGHEDDVAHGGNHEHEHGEWWCAEHEVPESDCALCDPKVAAKKKKAGDWCEEHDRPDSQCFVCHPENRERFAALYREKYGKEPPVRKE